MAALSPRGSLSGPSSEDIVDDFSGALNDLIQNNRFEIQNLTMIAKEYTEHAQAISGLLERHIAATPPERKLPALYLLDSIIKNVGTPYTVYLGRNLYSTFMNMYGLVDAQTRRSMEAVLKTWKDPIPESMDRRPVLSPELVKPIETALLKAKTALLRHVQQPQAPYGRNTATPPNGAYVQQYPQQQTYQYPQQQARPPSQAGYASQAAQAPSQEDLKRDLHFVLQAAEHDAQQNLYDPALSGRVRALHDLNMILYTRQCSPTDLQTIAAEIRQQQQRLTHNAIPQTQHTIPQWQQQPSYPPPQPTPQLAVQAPYGMPQLSQPPQIPTAQLSSLAALFSNVPKPSTPQMRAAAPSLQNMPPAQVNAIQDHAAALPPSSGTDLLAALSKAGIVKAPEQKVALPSANTLPPTPVFNPAQAGLADLLKSLNKAAPNASGARRSTIDLSSATALNTFRPELVRKLYPEQSDVCPQCGRRFPLTADGRKKKDMHLDWHFRVNQRVATSAVGRFRDWYIDDFDWIEHREFDESTADASTVKAVNADSTQRSKDTKQPYVRAPAGITQVVCSICYEEMRATFPEEIGDWVFMNAAINNGKIVHATCLAELQGNAAAAQTTAPTKQLPNASQQASLAAALAALGGNGVNRESSRTPDSALGKRKAEEEAGGAGKMLKNS